MGHIRMFDHRRFELALSDSIESRSKCLDVAEVDGMDKVRADLPGVKKGDISVRIDANQVQIAAETKQEKESKEGRSLLPIRLSAGPIVPRCGRLWPQPAPPFLQWVFGL